MRARVGSVPRERPHPFVPGQAGGDARPSTNSGQAGGDARLSIMMGGTDVLGFPMTPSSYNSQKFIEIIDEPGLSWWRSIRM